MVDPSLYYAFASDNCSGMCPEALAAFNAANQDCVGSYGEDRWTQRAIELIRDFFSTDCQVFFAFNGTAANSLALSALCQPFQSVICHRDAHVQSDECGCPEFFTGGSKLLTVGGQRSRVDLSEVERIAKYERGVHFPPAKALTITQATEAGTCYDIEQMQAVGQLCRRLGLHLHVDGARFACAVAGLQADPADLTWRAGVDCLTLGGTKNGMAVGECIVFFNQELASAFDFRCKRAGQLASKMRFLSAPWVGMLEGDAYLTHARHANQAAQQLATALRQAGIEIAYPPEANAVFAKIPAEVQARMLAKGWHFYDLFGDGQARLMCSWSTTAAEIEAFVNDLRALS